MFVHESLVCSEQLNWALFFRKILHVLRDLQFSSIFCLFEPFPAVTGWFEIHLFTWGQLMDSNTILKKVKHSTDGSRRKHDALRAGGENVLIWRASKLYLICLPGNMQVTSCCFEGIIMEIFIFYKIRKFGQLHPFKVFTPRALNASVVPSGAQWMVWTFLIVVFESSMVLSVKRWISNHTVTAGKGSNTQTWRIFLKNSAQFNCSEQTRDSWTTITKQETVVDHPGNLTQY